MKTGLMVGKFYPPHKGHLYVIDQARSRTVDDSGVDFMLVVVGSSPDEIIPGELRAEWLRQLVPTNTQVIHLPDDNPVGVTPDQDEFWTVWRRNLQMHLPFIPQYLFGSEDYINTLARWMGMTPWLIDRPRHRFPISATQIREDPKKHWEFIPDVVRPYYEELLDNNDKV
jgi:HTH-type transcriptional repressor of NAD biosynthesis genes